MKDKQYRIRLNTASVDRFSKSSDISLTEVLNKLLTEYNRNKNLRKKINISDNNTY